MKRFSSIVIFAATLFLAKIGSSSEYSIYPEMSFLVGIDLGASLDLDKDARSPANIKGEHVEAYSLGSFLFGLNVGFRFNENIGIESGWHEEQHRAHTEWGSRAGYQQGHLALRLSWPLATRQTPVLRLGPAVGFFSYGNASYGADEENGTPVVGGLVSATLEHEFVLGIVGTISLSYLPLYRFGMDGKLELLEECYSDEPDCDGGQRVIGEKDFRDGRLVHLLWLSAGIQFEWTFR